MVRRKVRVRIVTDPEKYRRHQRDKLFRSMRRVLVWGGFLTLAAVVVWLVIAVFFAQARPWAREPERGVNALGY
jgi:hypothetical protein